MQWFIAALKKYVVFTGRAQRAEYWWFLLIYVLIFIGLSIISAIAGKAGGNGVLGMLFALGMLLPSLAVAVRRLHDTDRSGWWMLIAFVPLIGSIVLLVFFLQDSKPGENRFGPNPKGL